MDRSVVSERGGASVVAAGRDATGSISVGVGAEGCLATQTLDPLPIEAHTSESQSPPAVHAAPGWRGSASVVIASFSQ